MYLHVSGPLGLVDCYSGAGEVRTGIEILSSGICHMHFSPVSETEVASESGSAP